MTSQRSGALWLLASPPLARITALGNDQPQQVASWQLDPFGRHEERYWDGERWTEKVRSSGTVGIDPPGVVPKPEHARANVPASPITDATEPVRYTPRHLPRVFLLAVVVLVAIVALVIVGIATA